MIPINHVILSVDERAAYRTESGLFIRADLGGDFDNITQWGTVFAAPEKSGVKKGEKVWFHHLLKDTTEKLSEQEFNWDLKQVEGKTYIIPKDKDYYCWGNMLIAKEGEDGRLEPIGDWIVCEKQYEKSISEFDVLKRESPNLTKEVYSDKVLINKEDSDYPIEIHGKEYRFYKPHHIVGEYKDGECVPKEGITFIRPKDEGDFVKKGLIWVKEKHTLPRGFGEVISSTHPDLNNGDEVIYQKIAWSRIKINGHEDFYAIQNDTILAKNESK